MFAAPARDVLVGERNYANTVSGFASRAPAARSISVINRNLAHLSQDAIRPLRSSIRPTEIRHRSRYSAIFQIFSDSHMKKGFNTKPAA
jgi:hypothetical protein